MFRSILGSVRLTRRYPSRLSRLRIQLKILRCLACVRCSVVLRCSQLSRTLPGLLVRSVSQALCGQLNYTP